MGRRGRFRVINGLREKEIEREARGRWEQKHSTPFPGLKEWIRSLIREQCEKEQKRG